ncbi:hypothetical protein, conserved [Eimeria maxima]|uniref:Peroxisomal membrane protein PEX16 n=1 Tax=Eimeria maxima TaxID=5804 RepID=U6M6R5_EIMMA|nr:hypothetical protein, conserved [Eimeria maxima]CDJ59711.1 hypothetical protein, conserved [Eimeria maxima]
MPKKRWANPRPGGPRRDAPQGAPPSLDCPSSSSTAPDVSKVPKSYLPDPSNPAYQKSESALSTHGGDLTEKEEDPGSPPPILLHSIRTSNGSDSASLEVSQEDACAFHSPRSLPGDSPDAGGSVIPVLPEAQPSSRCADTVDSAKHLRRLCERSGESCCGSLTQLSKLKNLQVSSPSGQEAQRNQTDEAQHEQPQTPVLSPQQRLPSEQKKVTTVSCAEAALSRISPVSESEGEWIRVEEPRDQDTEAADREERKGSLLYPPSSAATETYASLLTSPAFEAMPEQAAGYPICIGSAAQAGDGAGAENSSLGSLGGIGYRETIESGCGDAFSFPEALIGTNSVKANRKGLFSRLSLYAKSIAGSFTFHCGEQQEEATSPGEGNEFTKAPDSRGELSEPEFPAKQRPWRKERLLQGVFEWHRCILEMYGGAVEDVTRLALQVLPAHATDDQSERRFLIIQGLFDVFCIYRSHFLSPPGGLLQAEALHHQWKLRRECSLETSEVSRLADVSRTTAMPFLDGPPAERQEKTVDGLPTSVRLALYEMISLTLKVVRALQLVLEVSALRRGGEGPRFALCLRLELLKLVLKLIIRALTPFAFYCDEHSIYQALATQKEKQTISDSEKLRPFYGRRTGRKIPSLPSAARQVANDHQAAISAAAERQLPRQWALLVAVWLFNELKANASPCRLRVLFNLLRSTAWRPFLAEVLYHIRPFIYLYLLRRARNTKSWTPWLVATFIEANSISLLHGSPQVMEHLSPVEAAELHRRLAGLPYALLRPPFFDKLLARPIEAVDFVVRRVPLLNHFK